MINSRWQKFTILSLGFTLITLFLSFIEMLILTPIVYKFIVGILTPVSYSIIIVWVIFTSSRIDKSTENGNKLNWLIYGWLIYMIPMNMVLFFIIMGKSFGVWFAFNSISIFWMILAHYSLKINKDGNLLVENEGIRVDTTKNPKHLIKKIMQIFAYIWIIFASIISGSILILHNNFLADIIKLFFVFNSTGYIFVTMGFMAIIWKTFGNSKTKNKIHTYTYTVLTIVIIILFLIPVIVAPITISNADQKMETRFGIDWREPQTLNGRYILPNHYDLSSLYNGFNFPKAYTMEKDILFKNGSENGCDFTLRFDTYYPSGELLPNNPTVLFIHGGGWIIGDKGLQEVELFEYLASQGYIVFDIQYRMINASMFQGLDGEMGMVGMLAPMLSNEFVTPKITQGNFTLYDMIEDIGDFTKYLEVAENNLWGANLSNIVIMGNSAGAHLAGVSGFGYENPFFAGNYSSQLDVKGIVLFYPPNNMTDIGYNSGAFWSEYGYKILNGTPETNQGTYDAFTPSKLIDSTTAPCLILHGTADYMVNPEQSNAIVENALSNGVDIMKLDFNYGPHAFDFNPIYRKTSIYYIERWLAHVIL